MKKSLATLALLWAIAGGDAALAEGMPLDAAKKYLGAGELKAAVIELKNVLQAEPENADARVLIGEAYLKLGDGPSAQRAFEKARDLKVPKEKWLVQLGRAFLLQNDTKSLLDQIKPGDDLPAPLRAQVHGLIGAVYVGKGDTAKARENFDAALKLDPDASEALLGLTMLEAQQKEFKKAIEYANRVIAKDDKNLSAWVLLAEAKRLDGDNPGAIEAFGKALAIQPLDPRARLGRATAYLGANKLAEAAKDVAEIRKVAGEMPLAMYLQAVIDFQGQKLDEAQDLLVKVTNKMPDHLPSKLLLGTIAYQKGQYETAEKELSQFVARVPQHIPAIKLLAATRMKQGRAADAVAALKAVEGQAKDDVQLLSLLGSAYLQTKQFDLGNEYLSRAAELDPKAAAVKAQLGLGQIASGNLDQAVSDLKAAVDLDPNLVQADVMLVLALLQDKKYDAAIEAAGKLKDKLKDNPMPENLLGAAYLAKGDAEKAREHWKAALKLKPEYASARINLAKMELAAKNLDGAAKQYKEVLAHDPKNLSALIGLAQVAESRKQYDEMERYLAEAREKNPKALQPALMLSRYYLLRGKPLRALEIARDSESQNPEQPAALQNLALAQMASNQAASALATLKKLVAKVPDNPEYRHQLAQAYYKTGDKAAALAEWSQVVKSSPEYLPAYLAQAEMAMLDKKYDEALKIAETVKSKTPKSSTGLQLEGDVEFARKQYKAAETAYDKAFKLEATAPAARRLYQARRAGGQDQAAFDGLRQWLDAHGDDADAWLILGMGYQSVGRSKEALETYEKAYALKPDNPIIQNNLAWLYQEAGDKRALEVAEKLLPASENNPEVMDTIGWIYVQNGRLDKGLALLQDAAVHAPQQLAIRLHVAEALIKAGRKDEARRELEGLLKEKKDFPDRQKAEMLLKGL